MSDTQFHHIAAVAKSSPCGLSSCERGRGRVHGASYYCVVSFIEAIPNIISLDELLSKGLEVCPLTNAIAAKDPQRRCTQSPVKLGSSAKFLKADALGYPFWTTRTIVPCRLPHARPAPLTSIMSCPVFARKSSWSPLQIDIEAQPNLPAACRNRAAFSSNEKAWTCLDVSWIHGHPSRLCIFCFWNLYR